MFNDNSDTNNNGVEVFFTKLNYLDMNRSFMDKFIKNMNMKKYEKYDEIFITVNNIELNMKKLISNISYNENEKLVRWYEVDWKKCISKNTEIGITNISYIDDEE